MAHLVKNPYANAGDSRDMGLIPGLGRFPGEENGNPLQYTYLGNSTERELGGLQSWGHKESDTTECIHALNYLLGMGISVFLKISCLFKLFLSSLCIAFETNITFNVNVIYLQ